MSEVKRLEMDHKGLPFVDENGVYVLYEDYANLKEQFDFKQNLTEQVVALQKKCDVLAAENAALKSAISYVCDTGNQPDFSHEGIGCGLEDQGITDRYEAASYGWDEAMDRIYSEVMSCVADIETPATDADLNSVRAEGVEMFADSAYCSRDQHEYVMKFAAQLRAGEPS